MAAHWDTGFMVREPSWHRLERAVLKESPKTWEEARNAAGLTWDVQTRPVLDWAIDEPEPAEIPGWQQIVRDDKAELGERVLAIQQSSYAVITNSAFGDVVDAVIGRQSDEDPVTYEALFALYGGRQIVALLYFDEPLTMGDIDSSKTYRYLGVVSRHDGSGGLRILPTNVRIQCANTMNTAEAIDGRTMGITIRHTSNWEERVTEVSLAMQAARGESEKWLEFAHQLAQWDATPRRRDTYLTKMFPVSDDMTVRASNNQLANRTTIRQLLEGPTCKDIANSGYGLLMATTEWADHYRAHHTTDSLISRQLLQKQDPKARSARILRTMAGVKL